jgi:hypothetical protein
MDCPDHLSKNRIKQAPPVFRIPVGEQLEGTLDVSEQDRDLFAFAFQAAT